MQQFLNIFATSENFQKYLINGCLCYKTRNYCLNFSYNDFSWALSEDNAFYISRHPDAYLARITFFLDRKGILKTLSYWVTGCLKNYPFSKFQIPKFSR